jgi:hypothetical protein
MCRVLHVCRVVHGFSAPESLLAVLARYTGMPYTAQQNPTSHRFCCCAEGRALCRIAGRKTHGSAQEVANLVKRPPVRLVGIAKLRNRDFLGSGSPRGSGGLLPKLPQGLRLSYHQGSRSEQENLMRICRVPIGLAAVEISSSIAAPSGESTSRGPFRRLRSLGLCLGPMPRWSLTDTFSETLGDW